MKILFITYDGLTDPLGPSQIIPYLIGLSKKGHEFTIISCEKRNNFIKDKKYTGNLLEAHQIQWNPIKYIPSPPVISAFLNILKLMRTAKALHKHSKFDIIHCRSYIPALIGQSFKIKYQTKFVFEMIGFWADERFEGNIWNKNNWIYKQLYKYFKKKEMEFLSEADCTITGTDQAKEIILSWKVNAKKEIPIQVIPSCVDTGLFSQENINNQRKEELQAQLKINKDDFVISYLGSLGTWYMLDEMLQFFKQLLNSKSNAKFLFITQEPPESILTPAKKFNIPADRIIIQPASREEVPTLLSLSNLSIFFIKPLFSKKASSPTKFAEALSIGIPVICNIGIGDIDLLIERTHCGIMVEKFNKNEYDKVIGEIDHLLEMNKTNITSIAHKHFSLKMAVDLYDRIYTKLSPPPN